MKRLRQAVWTLYDSWLRLADGASNTLYALCVVRPSERRHFRDGAAYTTREHYDLVSHPGESVVGSGAANRAAGAKTAQRLGGLARLVSGFTRVHATRTPNTATIGNSQVTSQLKAGSE
jgi:hypothetical protein